MLSLDRLPFMQVLPAEDRVRQHLTYNYKIIGRILQALAQRRSLRDPHQWRKQRKQKNKKSIGRVILKYDFTLTNYLQGMTFCYELWGYGVLYMATGVARRLGMRDIATTIPRRRCGTDIKPIIPLVWIDIYSQYNIPFNTFSEFYELRSPKLPPKL